ncbi:glutamate-cysteine ligase, catalytic subunit domain-containing protein [Besnoitia besnoiti]|uniref:glutamate--cysteine ligase n=1 Tax=Besnoitia besnoiti TaxID=94643 RepID=A0A2A9MQL6_BESBE|nr:glutamate-cysteine ligase, catalytic subunit domain-containing protein [Besnoitia besnoiti]PFH38557.1 glutamate-cysteine ligase, catalytic subunit domain-containing protein [Besnoitia besnoiti]
MGFLEEGTPLTWRESGRYRQTVKRRGVREFIKLFKQFKDDRCDPHDLFWGDELELCLVKLDAASQRPQVLLAAEHALGELRTREARLSQAPSREPHAAPASSVRSPGSETAQSAAADRSGSPESNAFSASPGEHVGRAGTEGESADVPRWRLSRWHPEYGSHMIEAIPGEPFNLDLNSLLCLLPSMQLRRKKVQAVLPPGCFAVSLTSFPTVGALSLPNRRAGGFTGDKQASSSELAKRSESDGCGIEGQGERREDVFLPGDFSSPPSVPDPLHTFGGSIFVGDEVTKNHPRFRTLTANIRARRGKKVEILIPLFHDKLTSVNEDDQEGASLPQTVDGRDHAVVVSVDQERRRQRVMNGEALHDGQWIYMDHMVFGMGMHCTQVTFGCPSMSDARYLYDQLGVLAPLWLSLTAATPFLRGLVAATDTRWATIAGSVDCRTPEELRTIPKSRYGSFSLYISDQPPLRDNVEFYNDVPAPVDSRAYEALIAGGVDPLLARHVAFLFVRDPMVIFRDKLLQSDGHKGAEEEIARILEAEGQADWKLDTYDDNCITTENFENLQSTNWNSVRFKPPPAFKRLTGQTVASQMETSSSKEEEDIEARAELDEKRAVGRQTARVEGDLDEDRARRPECRCGGSSVECWRVEFRTPEIQLCDFENAACVALITVLVQVLLEERLDLYIPMSLNDANVKRSAQVNSILTQKFWFRKDIRRDSIDRSFGEFYLHEILFGVPMEPGRETPAVCLVPACLAHMERHSSRLSPLCAAQLLEFFDFLRHRTQGIIPTDAAFLRACLAAHPDYKRDSVVSQKVCFAVCDLAVKIGQGTARVPELFGPFADRVGMRVSDEGHIQGSAGSSKPVVTPDFPCPLSGQLAAVREQYCSKPAAAAVSPAPARGVQQGCGGGSAADSSGAGPAPPQGRDSVSSSATAGSQVNLASDSVLSTYLGARVPLTLQWSWNGGDMERVVRPEGTENTCEMGKGESVPLEENISSGKPPQGSTATRRSVPTTSEGSACTWMAAAATGGVDSDTEASDENAFASSPSLADRSEIPNGVSQNCGSEAPKRGWQVSIF